MVIFNYVGSNVVIGLFFAYLLEVTVSQGSFLPQLEPGIVGILNFSDHEINLLTWQLAAFQPVA